MLNLERIYLINSKKISEFLSQWTDSLSIPVELIDSNAKSESMNVDGFVVLTAGLDTDKLDQDIYDDFDDKRIPLKKIDLNGTLQVAVSGLNLWLENNKCKSILISGADDIVSNENFSRFLNRFLELNTRK